MHVGDGRAYQIGCDKTGTASARALTQDHTFSQLGEPPPEGTRGDDLARMVGANCMGDPLLACGAADQCPPLPAEVVRPHAGWLQQIGDVAGQLAGAGAQARPVTFFQADTDAAYRAQFSLQRSLRRTVARVEQANLAEAQRRHARATAALDSGKARLKTDKSSLKQDQQALQQQQAGLDHQAQALTDQARQQVARARQLEDQARAVQQAQLAATLASRRPPRPTGAGTALPRLLAKFPGLDHGPELVALPTGSYLRGSPADEPERSSNEAQHCVQIAYPLVVARYAVTFAEWDQCEEGQG